MVKLPTIEQRHVTTTIKYTLKRIAHFIVTLLAVLAAIQNSWPEIKKSLDQSRVLFPSFKCECPKGASIATTMKSPYFTSEKENPEKPTYIDHNPFPRENKISNEYDFTNDYDEPTSDMYEE